jgi:TolB-like protein/DNA-binding SARP family transcriptional activator/Tfp pilus assembly protein PilF
MLGEFSACDEAGRLVAITSKKNRALVAVLALSPRLSASRDRLANLLWGDRDDEHARSSLRQSLAILRKELGEAEALVISDETISLVAERTEVDAFEFLQLAKASDPVSLQRAAELYQGDLLTGLTILDPGFDDWLCRERQRLRELIEEVLTRLLTMSLAAGGQACAAATAQRLLAFDPLCEAACRALMQIHAGQAQTTQALKLYETLRDRLDRELAVTPEPETVQLYELIRQRRAAMNPTVAGALQVDIMATSQPLAPASDALPLPSKPSIAVLPFQNLSDDREQEYFADGMVEEIITALSRIRWLFVIARNSSFAYKRRAVDMKQIGRELGVRYVVEGSIRKAGTRFRISCQVIEAATGHHVWADRFEGGLTEVFDIQDRIAESVARAVEPNVRLAEINRARAKPTEDLTSYDLYLRAQSELYEYTAEGFKRAEMLLRAAVKRDPDYAEAIAVLAICVARQGFEGWRPLTEGMKEALELARRAARLDNASAEVLATGAYCEALCGGSFDRSGELATAALRANPNSINVQVLCGGAAAYAGQSDRAIELLQSAWRINPVDPQGFFTMRGLGLAYFFARRFEDTVFWENRVLRQQPDDNSAKRYLAASLAHLGRITEAQEVVMDLLRSQPNSSLSLSRLNTFQHSWMKDLYIEGLRKAGLPE